MSIKFHTPGMATVREQVDAQRDDWTAWLDDGGTVQWMHADPRNPPAAEEAARRDLRERWRD